MKAFGQLLVIGVSGAAIIIIVALLFPRCLEGPYEIIDPISRALWFDRILQEKPLWSAVAHRTPAMMLSISLLATLFLAAVPAMLGGSRRKQPGRPIIFAFAAMSLFLTIAIARYIRFPFAFIPLLLPVTYQYLKQWHPGPGVWGHKRSLLFASLTFPLVAAATTSVVMPSTEREDDAADFMAFDECPLGDFSVLGKVDAGRIMAPQGLSLRLAEAMPDGFSLGAIPFHRSSPGIRRSLEFFSVGNAQGRQEALMSFDYVAICRFPLRPKPGDAPVYTALAGGGEWPGLVRVPDNASNPFQLFRVDHSRIE